MALELALRVQNVFEYADCSGPWGALDGYPPYCTGGITYSEKISLIDAWVYNPATDRYRFIALMSQYGWPSWSYQEWTIHPETGAVESHRTLVGFGVAHAWTGEVFSGGLNKLYATYANTAGEGKQGIIELTRDDLIPTTWQVANPIVNATQISNLNLGISGMAVCPERKLVTICTSGGGMYTYDYSNYPATSTLLTWHPFPESYCWSAGYEDTQRMWALFSDNIWVPSTSAQTTLLKYNFFTGRVELVTELQKTDPPDRIAKVAWDSKRKKLGVMRIKAEDADGKANNAFEVYNPRPVMSFIAVPVNVSRLAPGLQVPFVTSLSGAKGESGAGGRRIELSASKADLLDLTSVVTEGAGSAVFNAYPESSQEVDTITVSYDETKVT